MSSTEGELCLNEALYMIVRDTLRGLDHLYNFKNVKNTHGGVLLLVKLQAKSLELD